MLELKKQSHILYSYISNKDKVLFCDVRRFLCLYDGLTKLLVKNRGLDTIDKIFIFTSKFIHYVPDDGENWKYPHETIQIREGDCEDMALVFNQLVLSSDITEEVYTVHTNGHAFNLTIEDGDILVYDITKGICGIDINDTNLASNINFIFNHKDCYGNYEVYRC